MRFQDIHRRVGQFEIHKSIMQDFPLAVMEVLGTCVVMRAEYLAVPDRVFYFGYSALFREVGNGEEIPTYRVIYGPSGHRFEEVR